MTKFQSMRTRITQSCTCPRPRTQSLRRSTIRTASRRSPKCWGRRTLVDSQTVKPEFRIVFPGVTDALAKDKELATDPVRGEVALRAACCALTGASESDEDALRKFMIEQCLVYAIKPVSA